MTELTSFSFAVEILNITMRNRMKNKGGSG